MGVTYEVKIANTLIKTRVISNCEELQEGLTEILCSSIDNNEYAGNPSRVLVVGLDIERPIWKLCMGNICLIIRLGLIRENANYQYARNIMSKFLQTAEFSFAGVHIEGMMKDSKMECRNYVELGDVAAAVKGKEVYRAYGLLDLADKVCGLEVKKEVIKSHKAASLFISPGIYPVTLTQLQVEDLTWSAFLTFHVANHLLQDGSPTCGDLLSL